MFYWLLYPTQLQNLWVVIVAPTSDLNMAPLSLEPIYQQNILPPSPPHCQYILGEQGQANSNKHSHSERGRMEYTQQSLIHSNATALERSCLEPFPGSVECSLVSSWFCNLGGAPKSIIHYVIWIMLWPVFPFFSWPLWKELWGKDFLRGKASFAFLLVKVWLSKFVIIRLE